MDYFQLYSRSYTQTMTPWWLTPVSLCERTDSVATMHNKWTFWVEVRRTWTHRCIYRCTGSSKTRCVWTYTTLSHLCIKVRLIHGLMWYVLQHALYLVLRGVRRTWTHRCIYRCIDSAKTHFVGLLDSFVLNDWIILAEKGSFATVKNIQHYILHLAFSGFVVLLKIIFEGRGFDYCFIKHLKKAL